MKNKFLLSILLFPLTVHAFSSTNVQYLYSNNIDTLVGNETLDKPMQTITLEHASSWKHGSNFFFTDMSSANFNNGNKHKVYTEWAPKLSLTSITNSTLDSEIFKSFYLAGELNQGNNFQAINLGLGTALKSSYFDFLELNIFNRKDTFNEATFQFTTAWRSHFSLLAQTFRFEGFLDYYGGDNGTSVVSQPRLLIELNKSVQVGAEFYYYKFSKNSKETLSPQAMIKWIW